LFDWLLPLLLQAKPEDSNTLFEMDRITNEIVKSIYSQQSQQTDLRTFVVPHTTKKVRVFPVSFFGS
jgi:hypothetical protein